jgi:hypothetical protein
MCRCIFMVMYSFILPFREAIFCSVSPRVFGQVTCAGEKSSRNSGIQIV